MQGFVQEPCLSLLIDLARSDLSPPLSQFNATVPNRDDMLARVRTINVRNADKQFSDERPVKAFERCWDNFDEKYSKALETYKPKNELPQRDTDDITEEILEISRSTEQTLQRGEERQPDLIRDIKEHLDSRLLALQGVD